MRGSRLISLGLAILAIVIFSYALANVTMRLQRHITAANQWRHDRGALAMAYAGIVAAAAANDDLAYGLLRGVAWDDTLSLDSDSLAMRFNGKPERLKFLGAARKCLPETLTAFNAQTRAEREICRRLVAVQP